MRNKLFVLILLICVMCFQIVSYAFEFQKPSWCSSAGRYNGYYEYIVSDDLKEIVKSSIGTSSDSSYISSAFDCFVADENRLYESAENSSLGNNIYKQVDFSAENVLYFDYYSVNENGNNRHSFYYFIPDNKTLNKDDLFYYVSPPKGPASSNTGNVYSKSTKTSVSGTFYRGYVSYDSNVDECSVCVQYDCFGPSNIPYNGTFEIESDIACYMTSSSIDDVYSGSVQPDNLEDILPKKYGVLEVPQDFQFHYDGDGGSYEKNGMLNDISFTWTQTDENYEKWTTEFLFYCSVRYRGPFSWLSKWKVSDVFLYDDGSVSTKNLKYKINHVYTKAIESEAFLSLVYNDLETDSPQTNGFSSFSVFARNKYTDGDCTYYSNWIQVDLVGTLDADGIPMIDTANSSQSDVRPGELDHTIVEIGYENAIDGDSGQDFSESPPSGPVNENSVYDGSVNPVVNDSKWGSLSTSITDGFGLAGEGGVIDMFSDLFSFIPEPIWALILLGLTVLISIALLKAVF